MVEAQEKTAPTVPKVIHLMADAAPATTDSVSKKHQLSSSGRPPLPNMTWEHMSRVATIAKMRYGTSGHRGGACRKGIRLESKRNFNMILSGIIAKRSALAKLISHD